MPQQIPISALSAATIILLSLDAARILAIKFALHAPIVRQIEHAPPAIIEFHVSRSVGVTSHKYPVQVEEHTPGKGDSVEELEKS